MNFEKFDEKIAYENYLKTNNLENNHDNYSGFLYTDLMISYNNWCINKNKKIRRKRYLERRKAKRAAEKSAMTPTFVQPTPGPPAMVEVEIDGEIFKISPTKIYTPLLPFPVSPETLNILDNIFFDINYYIDIYGVNDEQSLLFYLNQNL